MRIWVYDEITGEYQVEYDSDDDLACLIVIDWCRDLDMEYYLTF